jgi:ribose 5-phosphate isomerase B
MTIAIGSDHAGYALKEIIRARLESQGYQVTDFGTHSAEPADYPDIAIPLAQAVAAGRFERGILICGTGIGSSLAANKVRGARAAVAHETYSARMSREHNDVNILCLGGRVVGPELATEVVHAWLRAEFSGDQRHARRLEKIRHQETHHTDLPR